MVGAEVGPSEWLVIDQERIDRFAEATGDHQFIHVDPERAAKTPLGATIAHGYLTLSLLPKLSESVAVLPRNLRMAINYGLDRVRFLSPVKVGSAVRLRAKIDAVTEKAPGRLLVASEVTIEIRGKEQPALVARSLILFLVGKD